MLHETVIGGNSNSRPIFFLFCLSPRHGLRGGIGIRAKQGGLLRVAGGLKRLDSKR